MKIKNNISPLISIFVIISINLLLNISCSSSSTENTSDTQAEFICSENSFPLLRVNTNVTFDGSNSEGNIVMYEWDFGDGSPVENGYNLKIINHKYIEEKSYILSLKVTDNKGISNIKSVNIQVVPIFSSDLIYSDYNVSNAILMIYDSQAAINSPLIYLNGGIKGINFEINPSKTMIAYLTYDYNNYNGWIINTYNLNTNETTYITSLNGGAGFCGYPSWSNDNKFVYMDYKLDSMSEYNFYIYDLKTKEKKIIATTHFFSPAQSRKYIKPNWSSDGYYITFTGTDINNYGQLYSYDVLKEDLEVIYKNYSGFIYYAAFSPQNDKITFIDWDNTENCYKLCIIDKNGDNYNELITLGGGLGTGEYDWSHDGSRIAYITFDYNISDAVLSLFTLQTSAIETIRDLNSGIDGGHPKWSPDDKYISFTNFNTNAEIMIFDLNKNNFIKIRDLSSSIHGGFSNWE